MSGDATIHPTATGADGHHVPLLPCDVVDVPFGDRLYRVTEWLPGMEQPFHGLRALALDTETRELVKGAPVVPVMLQVAASGSDRVLFVRPRHFKALMLHLEADCPGAVWAMFNAPFDCKVLGWPDDPLWTVFCEGRLADIAVRSVLFSLANGTYMDHMSLDSLTRSMLKVDLCKDADLRLSFVPDVTLTRRQVAYGAQDSIATILNWELMPEALPTEDINLRGAFALAAISDLGIRQDEALRAKLDQDLLNVQISQRSVLKLFGIAPHMPELPDSRKIPGTNDRRQWLMEALERQYDIKLKRSPKSGRIVTEKKSLDLQLITNEIPVPTWLESSRVFGHAGKMRSAYLAPGLAGADGRVHARFTPMVKTGRTAASGPPLQQYPRDHMFGVGGEDLGELRAIWIPADGHCFLATDYNQLELCALAESCYRRFGHSRMGDLINDDVDVHLWFGCEMGRKKGMDFDPDDRKHPVTADLRQRAKAADFGIPGGLGPATFVAYARNYKVDLSLDEAKELIAMWLDAFPEMKEHLKHPVDTHWTLVNIRMFLRELGLEAPAVRTIGDLEDFLYGMGWSEERVRKATSNLTVYMVTTVTGRTKRNCTYCAAANMEFQAPSADGAKLALWEGYTRGWRIVNFIHDEILQEVSLRQSIEERTRFVREVEAVMCGQMQRVLPRMKIKVESALSERWLKAAKPVHDDNGNLLIWVPESQNSATAIERKIS